MTRIFEYVRTAKMRISLCIRAVRTKSSTGAFWIAKDAEFLHTNNEDSNQPAHMHRLICASLGAHVRRYSFSHCGAVLRDCTLRSLCALPLSACLRNVVMLVIYIFIFLILSFILFFFYFYHIYFISYLLLLLLLLFLLLSCLNWNKSICLPGDVSKMFWRNGKLCRPRSNCSFRSSLTWVFTVCSSRSEYLW